MMEIKKALVVAILLISVLLLNYGTELCSAQEDQAEYFRCLETCTRNRCDQLPDPRGRDRCNIKCEIQCRPG